MAEGANIPELVAWAKDILDKVPDDAPEGDFGRHVYVTQPFMSDSIVASVYAGTVFNLTPSGKYYTPWASSNVTEEEAEEDEAWSEELAEALEAAGLYAENGEGDPCDIFICRYLRDAEPEEE
jgi:hypothetical protein